MAWVAGWRNTQPLTSVTRGPTPSELAGVWIHADGGSRWSDPTREDEGCSDERKANDGGSGKPALFCVCAANTGDAPKWSARQQHGCCGEWLLPCVLCQRHKTTS